MQEGRELNASLDFIVSMHRDLISRKLTSIMIIIILKWFFQRMIIRCSQGSSFISVHLSWSWCGQKLRRFSLPFRSASPSQWESEWPPPSGWHSYALHWCGSPCLHRGQWWQSLHSHQSHPTAGSPGPSPCHPNRRLVWLALCFGEARLWEWLQPHRWVELKFGKWEFKSGTCGTPTDLFLTLPAHPWHT